MTGALAAPTGAHADDVAERAVFAALTVVQPARARDPVAPHDPVARAAFARGQSALPVSALAPEDPAAPGVGRIYGRLGLPCDARIEARAAPGGTVALRIEAPCQASSRVTIEHGALRASYLTSTSGTLETVFPAFQRLARYTAHLPGGEDLSVTVAVPGAEGYERMVTMWSGAGGLEVHAFEYGAAPGSAGHVWRGAPRAAAVAEAGRGGFLLSLGSALLPGARRAEVYSFPVADAAHTGAVRIALGAAVTDGNCGREIAATSLQIGRDLPGDPVDLAIAMPGCGSGEAYLMLKNLARDLKIAAQ